MHNQEMIDKLNEALGKAELAEKVRVLYTLLWETLQLSKEKGNITQLIQAINDLAKQEQEAISIIADIQRIIANQQEAEQTAVS